jgi:hypothetical protein
LWCLIHVCYVECENDWNYLSHATCATCRNKKNLTSWKYAKEWIVLILFNWDIIKQANFWNPVKIQTKVHITCINFALEMNDCVYELYWLPYVHILHTSVNGIEELLSLFSRTFEETNNCSFKRQSCNHWMLLFCFLGGLHRRTSRKATKTES